MDNSTAVICLTNLGDGVLLSPLISALSEKSPKTKILLIAKPVVCELYGSDPRISNFIPYTCSWFPATNGLNDGLTGFFNTVRIIRRFHCQIGLNTASDTRTNMLARLGGIRRLISAHARHGDWISSEMVAPDLYKKHEAERLVELASTLYGESQSHYSLNIPISSDDKKLAKSLLGLIQPQVDKPIVAVHPGANVDFKMWPKENFIKIGNHLIQKDGYQVIVLGDSGSEMLLAEEVADAIGPGSYSLAGNTPVRILLALLKMCSLYIGNDSGPMHIAAAAGCPTIAIFGATNPLRFGPYLPQNLYRIITAPSFAPKYIGQGRKIGNNLLQTITFEMVLKSFVTMSDAIEKRTQQILKGKGTRVD